MTDKKIKVASAAELQSEYEAALRKRHTKRSTDQGILTVENFYAYMPMHNYIYAPTRDTWPASSVNARISPISGIPASTWIDKNRAVEQLSWIPGEPMLIKDCLISEGGWIEEKGNTVFNLYRAPTIALGDPGSSWTVD